MATKQSLLQAARRRWGTVRVIRGGVRPKPKRRPKMPGTAMERKLITRVVGKALSREQMADAVRVLRAGARVKELEMNERLQSLIED